MEHVACELIEHDDVRHAPARVVQPLLAVTGADVGERVHEAFGDFAIERVVFHEPAARMQDVRTPERIDVAEPELQNPHEP